MWNQFNLHIQSLFYLIHIYDGKNLKTKIYHTPHINEKDTLMACPLKYLPYINYNDIPTC